MRAEEAERIVNWAFRQFTMKTLVKAGQRVATAEVWMGDQSTVNLVAAEDVTRLVPALTQNDMTAEVVYTGPVPAPIAEGAKVADLVIRIPDLPEARIPLVAETSVPTAGFIRRLGTAAGVLFQQVFPSDAPAS